MYGGGDHSGHPPTSGSYGGGYGGSDRRGGAGGAYGGGGAAGVVVPRGGRAAGGRDSSARDGDSPAYGNGNIGTVARIKEKRGYKDQWPWSIKLYTDESGKSKGDGVLNYEDPSAASSTSTSATTTTSSTSTSASASADSISHHELRASEDVSCPHDGLLFWQFMVAGSIAGCAEHMAMFPIDTIKTRMQALGSCPIKSVGVRTAFRSILLSDGPSGFYRGIAAMGLGAGPAHAVYFSVYEFFKKSLSGGNPNNHLAHAASGVFATVMSDAVLTPMDLVKQRLQLSGGSGGAYSGLWHCINRVLKEEGFAAFYASYRTTVLMNAPFTAVHFATYEAAKKGLVEISPHHDVDETLIVHATAGAAAGALAAFVTTPLDVVKTQLQCQGVCGCDRFTSGSIRHVIKTIVKKDGYKGLLRGWVPRMLFHAPAAAICWSTYEAAKDFFQDRNDLKNNCNET